MRSRKVGVEDVEAVAAVKAETGDKPELQITRTALHRYRISSCER